MKYYYYEGDEIYLAPSNVEIFTDNLTIKKQKYVMIENIRHDIHTKNSIYGRELFYKSGIQVSKEDAHNLTKKYGKVKGRGQGKGNFYITKNNEKLEVVTRNMLNNDYIDDRKLVSQTILKKHYNVDKSKDTRRRRIKQNSAPQPLQTPTSASVLTPLSNLNLPNIPNDNNGSELLRNLLAQYQSQKEQYVIDDSGRSHWNENNQIENIDPNEGIPEIDFNITDKHSEKLSTNSFHFFYGVNSEKTEMDKVLDQLEADMYDIDLNAWLEQLTP